MLKGLYSLLAVKELARLHQSIRYDVQSFLRVFKVLAREEFLHFSRGTDDAASGSFIGFNARALILHKYSAAQYNVQPR